MNPMVSPYTKYALLILQMKPIDKIYVFCTTANVKDANTNARFRLSGVSVGEDWSQDFPNLPHDERECGRSDAYEFMVKGKGITDETKLGIEIIDTGDGWLPSSIFAIGQTETGDYVVMAANPSWSAWFDRGVNPTPGSKPKHSIN